MHGQNKCNFTQGYALEQWKESKYFRTSIEFVSNQEAVNAYLGYTFNISKIEVNIFFQFVFEEAFYTILWYFESIQNPLLYLEF